MELLNLFSKQRKIFFCGGAILFIFLFSLIINIKETKACEIQCYSDTSAFNNNCVYYGSSGGFAWNLACVVNTASVSDVSTYFYRPTCEDSANQKACKINSCPTSFNTANGASCTIRDFRLNAFLGCDDTLIGSATGKWDASASQCIECNASNEEAWIYDIAYNSTSGKNERTTSGGSLNFDTACSGSVSANCDEKSAGCVGTAGYCNSTGGWVACTAPDTCSGGACVAPNALTLDVSWSVNPVTVSSTSTATFTVKKASDSSVVSGAAVTVTSVSCGTLPNPSSVTNGSGQTTSTFTAPGTGATCTINAKAVLTGYTDGALTTSITVSICGGSNFSQYDNYRYVKGESLRLDGLNPDGSGNWFLCIYNGSNSRKKEVSYSSTFFPQNITNVGDSVGVWKGLAVAGTGGCPVVYDANQGCASSTDVVECDSGKVGNCSSGSCNLSTYTCVAATATPTPTATPVGLLGCSCPTGSPVGCPPIGTMITCSMSDSNVSAFCGNAANAACSLIMPVGLPNCDCASLLTATPTATVTVTGTAAPGTTCGIDTPPSCKLGCLPQDPDCAAPGCTVSPSGVTICNPTLTNSFDLLVQNVTGWILGIIGSLALLFLIIGGIMYIGAGGDQDRIKTAKTIVTAVVIGLIVVIASYSIINEIKKILGY